MGDKNSEFRVVCPGLPPVMCNTLKYAREVRDGHEGMDCYIEQKTVDRWVHCD